jgi:urease accessory protein
VLSRASSTLVNHSTSAFATSQTLRLTLKADAALYLLPDPVTCFEDAMYNQIQHFQLEETSSLIILDWVTSGRRSRGEDWAFSRYYSVNEIIVGSTRIAKDIMLLEGESGAQSIAHHRKLSEKLAPYACYGTLILYGPSVQRVIEDLQAQYKAIVVFKRHSPDNLIWSLSPLSGKGVVVRIAGQETESVKHWLRTSLGILRDLVGEDAYRKAFV